MEVSLDLVSVECVAITSWSPLHVDKTDTGVGGRRSDPKRDIPPDTSLLELGDSEINT